MEIRESRGSGSRYFRVRASIVAGVQDKFTLKRNIWLCDLSARRYNVVSPALGFTVLTVGKGGLLGSVFGATREQDGHPWRPCLGGSGLSGGGRGIPG